MRKYLLCAAAAFAMASSPAVADLTGDTVNGTYYFPDSSSVYSNQGNQTVSPLATFTFLTGVPNVTAAVGGSSILLSFDANGGFNGASFNGVKITDLTASNITNVFLDASTSVSGFDASRLSFTSNSVSFNLQGLTIGAQNSVRANLSFGSEAPEPGTWAMMLLGMGAVGFAMRRRRSQGVSLQAA